MGKRNGLPKDHNIACCCGHDSGMHISSRMKRTRKRLKWVPVAPDETHCAWCGCSQFIAAPVTWQPPEDNDPIKRMGWR
jgi:hypothetical protein